MLSFSKHQSEYNLVFPQLIIFNSSVTSAEENQYSFRYFLFNKASDLFSFLHRVPLNNKLNQNCRLNTPTVNNTALFRNQGPPEAQ